MPGIGVFRVVAQLPREARRRGACRPGRRANIGVTSMPPTGIVSYLVRMSLPLRVTAQIALGRVLDPDAVRTGEQLPGDTTRSGCGPGGRCRRAGLGGSSIWA